MTILVCPACGSQDHDLNVSESPALGVRVGGREFLQPAYGVHCCSNCGLYYKTTVLDPAELSDYYQKVDFRKWETAGYFPTERKALAFLRTLPKKSVILDYGCSTGRLLAGLVHEYQCNGYEINADAASKAQQKGLRMWTSRDLDEAEGLFDAVVLSDVFEHLSRPAETLNSLCNSLKSGGSLLIVTGNGDARFCRRNPAMFWYFRTVEHLCMLTRKHAAYMEQVLPLRLAAWQEVCHYDVGLKRWFFEHARNMAYWGSRPEAAPWSRSLLGLMPVVRRAQQWANPPSLTCTKDHVVAVFQKL